MRGGVATGGVNGDGRKARLQEKDALKNFERLMLPHLDAAHNLARWLTRNETDAEDVVQEAFLRAFKFFATFRGSDSRRWLLAVVRNTCFTWLRQNRAGELLQAGDGDEVELIEGHEDDPEEALAQSDEREQLRRAIEELPAEFREVIVLRELEGMSYREIASVASVPVGTVMSRLARARRRLRRALTPPARKGGAHGV
jgi:RNA polymerase sigma-70 factor, ECF subfamily